MSFDRIALVEKLVTLYNAQDADGYADLFVEDGAEGAYRGAVAREGREGIRTGLKAVFAEFPENRLEVQQQIVMGDTVVLHERVWRTAVDEPFDVLAIYSFRDGQAERVEFIR